MPSFSFLHSRPPPLALLGTVFRSQPFFFLFLPPLALTSSVFHSSMSSLFLTLQLYFLSSAPGGTFCVGSFERKWRETSHCGRFEGSEWGAGVGHSDLVGPRNWAGKRRGSLLWDEEKIKNVEDARKGNPNPYSPLLLLQVPTSHRGVRAAKAKTRLWRRDTGSWAPRLGVPLVGVPTVTL